MDIKIPVFETLEKVNGYRRPSFKRSWILDPVDHMSFRCLPSTGPSCVDPARNVWAWHSPHFPQCIEYVALPVFPRSKLPTCICSTEVNKLWRMFAWKVVNQFHNRKTGDSPIWASRKGQTRKSKINRNLCPRKPYDKEFKHFYLPIKYRWYFEGNLSIKYETSCLHVQHYIFNSVFH
jgi:hypothetical protein